jgi:hypothetical protein
MVSEKAIVLCGKKRLDEPFGQLLVAHGYPALLADGGNQLPIAGIDPQRYLQLDVPQAVHVGEGWLQVDISTDVGERN